MEVSGGRRSGQPGIGDSPAQSQAECGSLQPRLRSPELGTSWIRGRGA
jgi:hypothetical protein